MVLNRDKTEEMVFEFSRNHVLIDNKPTDKVLGFLIGTIFCHGLKWQAISGALYER